MAVFIHLQRTKSENMKKILLPLMAAFMLLISCTKETSEENGFAPNTLPTAGSGGTGTGTTGVTGDFRAKIDGVQFIANQTASASRLNGIINLTGLATDGKLITITLMDSGVHVYTLNDVSFGAGAYGESQNGSTISFTSNGSSDPAVAGGSCTITSIDAVNHKMTGTFAFKVFRQTDSTSKNITQGVFTNITYSTTLPVPATAATDTFRVKLDGVDWTNYSVIGLQPPGFGQISITSNSDAAGTKNIGIIFSNTITPGSYPFDLFTTTGIYNPTNSLTTPNPYAANSGTLQIIEHNTVTKRIRGNFNFIATPFLGTGAAINFTQGYFSITYQ